MSDTLNALVGGIHGGGSLPAPVVLNPLGAMQGALQTAGDLYKLRDAQAQEAAGQAFQASIDPATGQPDQAKLMQLLAGNPRAAMAAQAAAQRGQTLDADTYKLHSARMSQANSAIGSLIGQYPNGIPQDAANAAVDREVATGLITPAEAQQLKGTFGSDPRQNSVVATQLYYHNMNNQQQLDRMYGTRQPVAAGGSTEIVTVPPPGPGQPNVSVTHTQTPGEAGGQVTWQGTDGTTHYGTGAQYATERGLGRVVGPATTVLTAPPSTPSAPGTSTAPPPPPPGTSVRGSPGAAAPPLPTPPIPPAGQGATTTPGQGGATAQPPAAPAATAAPPAVPPGPKLTDTTGPRPGQTEAATATATQGAALGTALTARADQVPTNKANYGNMLADLDRIGRMPAGGEKEVAINTFLQKATGYGLTMTRDQVAAANSFAKLANIAVGQQLAAIGGTDARQALFMGSNPNLDLSKLGNTQIIHMLQGNEDAIAAKSRAWQAWLKSGKGADTYGQFQDDFNHHFDPRVFQQQYMGPDEIAALRKSMGPGEARKFLDDVRYAREQGWVQ